MTWIRGPLRRFLCGLGGHELMRSYSPGRISLRCVSCPYESPGWVLKESRQPAPEVKKSAGLPARTCVLDGRDQRECHRAGATRASG